MSMLIKITHFTFLTCFFMFCNCASVCQKPSPNKPDIKKLFNSGKDLYIENITFHNAINLTEMLASNPVSDGINQIRVPQSVTFKNCTFEKDLCAYSNKKNKPIVCTQFQSNLSFIDCIFKGEVDMRACTIMGRAIFTQSVFAGNTYFNEVSFHESASFAKCVFMKETSFSNSIYMQFVNFMDAEFYDNVSFQNSVFYATAQFSNTKYKKYTDFSATEWRGNIFFNYLESTDRIYFNHSYFSQNIELLGIEVNYGEIKECRFMGDLLLKEKSSSGKLALNKNYFLNPKQ